MNCQSCREKLAEFSDGRLGEKEAANVRDHLVSCAACAAELESTRAVLASLDALPTGRPTPRLRAAVMGHIEAEKLTQRSRAEWAASIRAAAEAPTRRQSWRPAILQAIGVCSLVVAAFVVGERTANQRQLADLRVKVDTMGQLVEQSVLQKRTAGDRLEAVLTEATLRKPDDRAIDGLINSMAFDPSVNVRLNALTSLYMHADQEVVRAGVLACLPRETNPLVQISMIDFLVATKAHEALPELSRLVQDGKTDADVRDSAKRALEIL
ncbi:MAG TPA: HEAT repeat domain-containing protein [Opitutaceae bacterium]|jgi:anti-sigma factor RsiW